ncbi:MAG: YihY/virulence factor BrkB family protein [Nitrospirae bacterium]|nr:YihY/virulence factor BrkB family protein [Nitrospirota bacterium]
MRVLFKSFVDFFRDDGPMLAGSMSYFFVMAIVPFSILLIVILGYFLGENREFYDFFLKKLLSFFPTATYAITKELGKIITNKRIGVSTLFLYGIFSYQLYSSVERAINVIFKINIKRSKLISIFLSMVIVTLMISFIIISFGASSAISMLKFLDKIFPGLVISKISSFLIGFVIPLFLIFLTVTTLYILLPRKNVMFRHAILGGLFTALLLETAKHLFTFYVTTRLYQLGAIYGPVSVFITFLLWVFYSACVFLIGAEVVHNLGVKRMSHLS